MVFWRKILTPTTAFSNSLVATTASGWAVGTSGNLTLANNKTAKAAVVKLDVPIGSRFLSAKVHLGISADDASADHKTKYTLSLRKVINKADGVTDTEIKGVAEVTIDDDTKVDAVINSSFVVEEGYSYYIRVTSTTGSNAASKNNLIGATYMYQ